MLIFNNLSFHKQKKLKLKMTQMQSTTGSGVLGCVKRIKIAQMGHFAFCGNQTINVAKNLTKKVFTQIFLILSNRNNYYFYKSKTNLISVILLLKFVTIFMSLPAIMVGNVLRKNTYVTVNRIARMMEVTKLVVVILILQHTHYKGARKFYNSNPYRICNYHSLIDSRV